MFSVAPDSPYKRDQYPQPFTKVLQALDVAAVVPSYNEVRRDLCIAFADRRMGELKVDECASGTLPADVVGAFWKSFSRPKQGLIKAEAKAKAFALAGMLAMGTCRAFHVRLLLGFSNDGGPPISWRDQWTVEEYA